VQSSRDADLEVIDETDPSTLSRAVSQSTAAELREMMVDVVERGSGTVAALGDVQVAGKTGTAEFGDNGAAHAWFTGFAPADDPQIAMAVVVESAADSFTGESGGRIAAPIGRDVLAAGVDR